MFMIITVKSWLCHSSKDTLILLIIHEVDKYKSYSHLFLLVIFKPIFETFFTVTCRVAALAGYVNPSFVLPSDLLITQKMLYLIAMEKPYILQSHI